MIRRAPAYRCARRPRFDALLIALLALGLAGVLAARPSFATPSPPTSSLRDREPPRLSEGPRIALPPTVIPLDRPRADRRPVYVGAAFVMLAVAMWWNRRRRDRFDREDRALANAARPARRRRPRDDDAEDLHAAARGDAPAAKPPDDHPDDHPGDRPDPTQPRQPS